MLELDKNALNIGETTARLTTLTKTEKEILGYVFSGYTSKEISSMISRSYRTVEIHRGRIMVKMKALNMQNLIQMLTVLVYNTKYNSKVDNEGLSV